APGPGRGVATARGRRSARRRGGDDPGQAPDRGTRPAAPGGGGPGPPGGPGRGRPRGKERVVPVTGRRPPTMAPHDMSRTELDPQTAERLIDGADERDDCCHRPGLPGALVCGPERLR